MSGGNIDYRSAGVDYEQIDALKVRAQQAARVTARHLHEHGAHELERSRGESAYVIDVGGKLVASVTECLGTKALVADATRPLTGRTHYHSIAQDTIAMAVNDLLTVGATPLAVQAYWAAGSSEWFADTERMRDLISGWQAACDLCHVSWGGGETPALNGVVAPERIDLAASCIGVVEPRERLLLGERLAPGDTIVLFASSGIHANGVTLARRIAERLDQGYGARLEDGRGFGEALLDPTILYAPVMQRFWASGATAHYCVNITGHGWRKLMRHPQDLTYRITSIPPVPPVLRFLQRQAALDDREAYGSLNMGAGFALFLPPPEAAAAVSAARAAQVPAWIAGCVESGPRRVVIEPLRLSYDAHELELRA